jgi:ribosomal protein S12 methylthiotransferase accessory factor
MTTAPPADLQLLDVDLASPAGQQLLAATAARHGAGVAASAGIAERLFLLRSSEAPGLRFVGGTARVRIGDRSEVVSISGAGETLEDALAACLGEGVERMAQWERAGDIACRARPEAVADDVLPSVAAGVRERLDEGADDPRRPLDWVSARCLATGRATLVPADWCLRRGPGNDLQLPGTALSTGAAAGPSTTHAAVAGLLELIERDAAALWWLGGHHGRPLSLEGRAIRDAVTLLQQLRSGGAARRSWLIDITSDLGIPVIAALSVDRNGGSLACGLAARLDREAAARKALLEMAQMELGNALVARKVAEGGEAALDPAERRLLMRNTVIGADCHLLHPRGSPAAASSGEASELSPEEALAVLSARLAGHGIEVALVHLQRPDMPLATVCAIAPALQQLPSEATTQRLRNIRRVTHEDGVATLGMPLL